MAILHERMGRKAEFGLFARALAIKARFRIGGALMRGVAPLLAFDIDGWIAWIIIRRGRWILFRCKAFQARPGIDQSAVDREVLVAYPAPLPGQFHHLGKEQIHCAVLEEALLVLAEGRVV